MHIVTLLLLNSFFSFNYEHHLFSKVYCKQNETMSLILTLGTNCFLFPQNTSATTLVDKIKATK